MIISWNRHEIHPNYKLSEYTKLDIMHKKEDVISSFQRIIIKIMAYYGTV